MKFLPALCLLFITLKLLGVITWSWWLVLLPIYFPLAVVLGMFLLFIGGVFGLSGAATLYEKVKFKKK